MGETTTVIHDNEVDRTKSQEMYKKLFSPIYVQWTERKEVFFFFTRNTSTYDPAYGPNLLIH